jgi:hypothetical protein
LSWVGSFSLFFFLFLRSGWHCGIVVMLCSTEEYLKHSLNQFWFLKSQIWLCRPLQSWREVLQYVLEGFVDGGCLGWVEWSRGTFLEWSGTGLLRAAIHTYLWVILTNSAD